MTNNTTSTRTLGLDSVAGRVLPAVLAVVFGAFLVFGVGFAHPSAIHNAAHDGRHAFAFPCH